MITNQVKSLPNLKAPLDVHAAIKGTVVQHFKQGHDGYRKGFAHLQ